MPLTLWAQPEPSYWQQEVDYKIDIRLNPEDHRFRGTEKLLYINNSPDTLDKAFFHLYFNAFQPNSMMDVRSRNIPDPDKRVGDRISKLDEDEIGIQKVVSLKKEGQALYFEEHGTILKALMNDPIAPGDTARFDMEFEGQVPVQIRRSGRDNAEGVDYTMTQWYPKIAEYDNMGWHPNPYVAREFYAPFGSFEVNIDLPADYKVAATGSLENFDQYWQEEGKEGEVIAYKLKEIEAESRRWTFKAENIHDFAWAADEDYYHRAQVLDSALTLHFFYLDEYDDLWSRLPRYAAQFFREMNQSYGRYPYPQFSVIQGGDGGMEYPMCTMLKGTGKISGLVGVTVHEGAHNWFYGILGSNETRFPWMDEGFTSFAEEEVLNAMSPKPKENPHSNAYAAHAYLASRPEQLEPLATTADRFERNRTYGINSYSRGEIFLAQLRYIIGQDAFDASMKKFFNSWKFKHPEPWDLINIAEKESGIQLDWYYNQWVYTNKLIDYGFSRVKSGKNGSRIEIERLGEMSMPLRIRLKLRDGRTLNYYIPTHMQLGAPKADGLIVAKPWPWTHPDYQLEIEYSADDIESMEIDPMGFMADINRTNNKFPQEADQN